MKKHLEPEFVNTTRAACVYVSKIKLGNFNIFLWYSFGTLLKKPLIAPSDYGPLNEEDVND
jgi:hypothetical protein